MIRLISLIIFSSLILTGCNSDKKPKSYFNFISFSYFDISPLSFTLNIYNQDSVFLTQNFSPDKGLSKDKIYKTALIGKWKQQLDSLIAIINFSKLDSVYETGHLDGDEYRLEIESETGKRHFKVHSMNPPKELEAIKELFLNIRLSFLPLDTTSHLESILPKMQVQGNAKTFILGDINNDKYYLADSINKIFHAGHIGQTPLIAINGITFKYQRKLDTVLLPLSKKDILNIGYVNKKSSQIIYGKAADSGAIIIQAMTK